MASLFKVMAHGKSQFATWSCPDCGTGNYLSAYNKKNNEGIVKTLRKHCGLCRKTTEHKRKDTKKAAK